VHRDKPPPESQFSESDRAKLDQLLDDEQFKRRLEEHHVKRREAVRTWATWLITIVAALSLIRDAGAALIKHVSEWIGSR
jgi:hypothetical protein